MIEQKWTESAVFSVCISQAKCKTTKIFKTCPLAAMIRLAFPHHCADRFLLNSPVGIILAYFSIRFKGILIIYSTHEAINAITGIEVPTICDTTNVIRAFASEEQCIFLSFSSQAENEADQANERDDSHGVSLVCLIFDDNMARLALHLSGWLFLWCSQ
eukprot:12705_1